MTVIVDANILISAILNPKGNISQILSFQSDKFDFVAPLFIKEEITSKRQKLCTTSGMTYEYFAGAEKYYYGKLLFFSAESIGMTDVKKASILTENIDKKDTLYVALAISLDGVLWTGDMKLYRSLRRNGFMSVVSTKELIQTIKGFV